MKKYSILFVLVPMLIVAFILFRTMLPTTTASSAKNAATFAAIRATADASRPTPPPPTPTPTLASSWRTIATFSGTSSQNTAVFTVGYEWRITWTCRGYSDGIDGVFTVSPFRGNANAGTVASSPCRARGQTSGHVVEYGGGQLWLLISAAGNGWTVQVQVPA